MRFCEWNFQNAFFGALEFRMTGHPGHKCEFTHHQAAKQHFTISCSFFALIKMQWTKLVRKSGNFICLVQIAVWFLYKINKKHFILISELEVVTKMALCIELKTSIVLKLTLLKLIFFPYSATERTYTFLYSKSKDNSTPNWQSGICKLQSMS